ncbi:hypothetical protein [Celeribacter marinus]|uniref:hypothetical protein n=1 Tax=Celeribacter marinus TaxID=1397108 RepID=UPI0007823450|nr:hypothetical protein [Celeribacter marinus]SFK49950.1 hypothetical protein SAMN05444421_1052 [Celeribacter marinus]
MKKVFAFAAIAALSATVFFYFEKVRTEGGFSSIIEWNRYQNYGIGTMAEFEATGFSTLEEYDRYRVSGLETLAEFEATGFSTLAEYELYSSKGIETLADFQKTGFSSLDELERYGRFGFESLVDFQSTGFSDLRQYSLFREHGDTLDAAVKYTADDYRELRDVFDQNKPRFNRDYRYGVFMDRLEFVSLHNGILDPYARFESRFHRFECILLKGGYVVDILIDAEPDDVYLVTGNWAWFGFGGGQLTNCHVEPV